MAGAVELQEEGHEEGQCWCFQEVDEHVLPVGQLAQQITLEVDLQLPDLVGDSEGAFRHGAFIGYLGHTTFHLRAEHFVPRLGPDTALIRFVAVFIHELRFQDVEDLLRVHIAARTALAHFAVDLAGNAFEVHDGINRVAVVHRMAFLVHQQEAVEQFEDVR